MEAQCRAPHLPSFRCSERRWSGSRQWRRQEHFQGVHWYRPQSMRLIPATVGTARLRAGEDISNLAMTVPRAQVNMPSAVQTPK